MLLQVRITAAQQLPTLARVLGIAAAISQLLPELTELLTDDEVQVGMQTEGMTGGRQVHVELKCRLNGC